MESDSYGLSGWQALVWRPVKRSTGVHAASCVANTACPGVSASAAAVADFHIGDEGACGCLFIPGSKVETRGPQGLWTGPIIDADRPLHTVVRDSECPYPSSAESNIAIMEISETTTLFFTIKK